LVIDGDFPVQVPPHPPSLTPGLQNVEEIAAYSTNERGWGKLGDNIEPVL
jgi:hypothetical protein